MSQSLNISVKVLELDLFREFCNTELTKDIKYTDRYGHRCAIYDSNNNRIFETRYHDYPWN